MPKPAYQVSKGSILDIDKTFYDRVKAAPRTLKDSVTIPIRYANTWEVKAGEIFRIKVVDGPQVGDLNIWNLHNPKERMWASRTRQLQAAHISTYDRIWSNLPYLRPMTTIIDDSLAHYGVDSNGGRVHDLLGTRCDPYVNKLLTGEDFDFHCHSNLVRAVRKYGLEESDVHDVLNVFQLTGLNDEDKYFMQASPGNAGDYLEFFAEIDLLCALSCCPGGDLSVDLWGEERKDPLLTCNKLEVDIYSIDESVLKDFKSPKPAYTYYKGNHGLQSPSIDWGAKKDDMK